MSSPTALKSRILLLIWCQLVLRERLLNGYFSCLMVWVLLRDRLLWKAGYTMLSKLAGVLGEVFSVLKVVGKTWCSSVDDMQLNDGYGLVSGVPFHSGIGPYYCTSPGNGTLWCVFVLIYTFSWGGLNFEVGGAENQGGGVELSYAPFTLTSECFCALQRHCQCNTTSTRLGQQRIPVHQRCPSPTGRHWHLSLHSYQTQFAES